MTIVIGCDSFLALRNVRNGDLGHRLKEQGERVVVLVDPQQYEGSLDRAPRDVEIQRLLPFDPYHDPGIQPAMYRAYMARKAYYDPKTLWTKVRASSTGNGRSPLRRAASLSLARAKIAYYGWAGRMGRAQVWRQEFAQVLQQHPVVTEYETMLADLDAELVV
ncbi:MAG: hypothetical protein GYB65_15915, partial [Chloroflexi bacterium]|nr:hypothetical protein [Chloroflexota bacterium]